MGISLENKIVLITGASSGIGAACAKLFAKEKAKLILVARRTEKLTALQKSLSSLTAVHIITLDIRDSKVVAKAMENLPPEWKAIDILINNAGLAKGLEKIAEGHIDNWEEMIDTNFKGLLYVSRVVMPGMLKRNRGHIINIGSLSGREVYSGGAVYCATKFAVRAISQSMKLECHGTPIRVTEIAPGAVETEFSVVRYDGDKARANKTYEGTTPLKADDIADAVLYTATRPAHLNISELVLMMVDQSGVRTIYRRAVD